jgi:hypothetical protein
MEMGLKSKREMMLPFRAKSGAGAYNPRFFGALSLSTKRFLAIKHDGIS